MSEPGREKKLTEAVHAVLDAKRAEAKAAREARQRAERRAKRQPFLVALIIVGWGLLAWIWIAKPDFVFHPERLAVTPARDPEAAMRFAMFLEHARVMSFHDRTGAWPASLAAAGPVEAGVGYEPRGGEFVLKSENPDVPLVLTRRMAPDSFLGDALSRLQGHQVQ